MCTALEVDTTCLDVLVALYAPGGVNWHIQVLKLQRKFAAQPIFAASLHTIIVKCPVFSANPGALKL